MDDDGFVKKIGTWTVPESILIGANTRHENDAQYGERLAVAFNGIMPASDRPASKVADVEEDDDEVDEDEDAADESEGDEVEARQEELEGMTLAKLKAAAKELGITIKRGSTAEDIIEAILDVEFPEDADEEAEDEPEEDEEAEEDAEEDEEPEGDEFDEMDRAALKKFNTTEKLGVKVTTKMTDDDLRDAIRAALPDDEEEPEEEEADEEEPEPTPAPRKGRARAQAASPTRSAAKRRKGSEDEPPF
ncbi:MAG: hypothetical protein IPK85_03085 [Gemmatimonadetes bacterium]|nr:hypothetical protein [Gemmatimonadota bacterium]